MKHHYRDVKISTGRLLLFFWLALMLTSCARDATPTPVGPILVTIITPTGCFLGPGEPYEMISVIPAGKEVQLLGFGNIEGWYVIMNPYFDTPCWVSDAVASPAPNVDITHLPVFEPVATPDATATPNPSASV